MLQFLLVTGCPIGPRCLPIWAVDRVATFTCMQQHSLPSRLCNLCCILANLSGNSKSFWIWSSHLFMCLEWYHSARVVRTYIVLVNLGALYPLWEMLDSQTARQIGVAFLSFRGQNRIQRRELGRIASELCVYTSNLQKECAFRDTI